VSEDSTHLPPLLSISYLLIPPDISGTFRDIAALEMRQLGSAGQAGWTGRRAGDGFTKACPGCRESQVRAAGERGSWREGGPTSERSRRAAGKPFHMRHTTLPGTATESECQKKELLGTSGLKPSIPKFDSLNKGWWEGRRLGSSMTHDQHLEYPLSEPIHCEETLANCGNSFLLLELIPQT
jgi:hypothetical protein